MTTFQDDLQEYKAQLERGAVQRAYRGLMEYLMDLRTHLQNGHPDHFVSGSLYYGYMDMTYFSFTPPTLQERKLKVAIVFLHEAFRFEVWLGGGNKQVQSKYWGIFKDSGWTKYRLVPTTQGADSILEHVLVDDPDFRDREALTARIERQALAFSADVQAFLSAHHG